MECPIGLYHMERYVRVSMATMAIRAISGYIRLIGFFEEGIGAIRAIYFPLM